MPRESVLFLGEVPGARALQSALGVAAHFANAPLEAARLLALLRPVAVALGRERAWSQELVEALSPAERPAVLAVGARDDATRGLADQWLPPEWEPADARCTFKRALARARHRVLESLGPHQPLDRSVFLHALVRKCDRERRRGGALSVVVFRFDGGSAAAPPDGRRERQWLPEEASILRGRTRRTDLCGRLGERRFAVALHGGRSAAQCFTARMTALLEARGVAIASGCHAVAPQQPLRWLREPSG